MYKYDRTDFIETHFKDALVNSYETHKASIETMQSDFQRHQDRLAVVRQEKDRARLELLGELLKKTYESLKSLGTEGSFY